PGYGATGRSGRTSAHGNHRTGDIRRIGVCRRLGAAVLAVPGGAVSPGAGCGLYLPGGVQLREPSVPRGPARHGAWDTDVRDDLRFRQRRSAGRVADRRLRLAELLCRRVVLAAD